MKKKECELCAFNNPKCSTAAVIIMNGHVLLLKRKTEPFKGMWDFPGGYVDSGEQPIDAVRREIQEELSIAPKSIDFINVYPGTGAHKDKEYAIMNFAYLVTIDSNDLSKIKLDHENSDWKWFLPHEVPNMAFDSNQKILSYVQHNFSDDWKRVQALLKQLDPSAQPSEENFYKAVLNGYVSRLYEAVKLIGLGWIFPRQTLLRKQAVVEDMIVDEIYRGSGRGEIILRDLLHWAKDQGVEVVELTTNPKRESANKLYQKVGFRLHVTNHYLLDL